MGLLCFVSSRKRVRRTLHDFYSPSFLPEAMVKLATRVNGHLVAFLEVGIHLFECNLQDISVCKQKLIAKRSDNCFAVVS